MRVRVLPDEPADQRGEDHLVGPVDRQAELAQPARHEQPPGDEVQREEDAERLQREPEDVDVRLHGADVSARRPRRTRRASPGPARGGRRRRRAMPRSPRSEPSAATPASAGSAAATRPPPATRTTAPPSSPWPERAVSRRPRRARASPAGVGRKLRRTRRPATNRPLAAPHTTRATAPAPGPASSPAAQPATPSSTARSTTAAATPRTTRRRERTSGRPTPARQATLAEHGQSHSPHQDRRRRAHVATARGRTSRRTTSGASEHHHQQPQPLHGEHERRVRPAPNAMASTA